MGHARAARTVHHAHDNRLLQLVVVRAHRGRVQAAEPLRFEAGTFQHVRHLGRFGAAGLLDSRGQHLHQHLHAHMHVVVARLGEALAEGGVESLGRRTAHIRLPLGHSQHAADAGLANGCWRAQRVAVKRVELGVGARLAQSTHQQREVVAPISGEHSLRAAGLDLGGIGQEVFDTAERVQLVADDLDVGPLGADHRACLCEHMLAKAVVLADQVHALDAAVALQHVGQRGQAHVGMRVEAEVPEAAALVGQRRVHGRVVQQQGAALRLARVVRVQRIDQGRRGG